MNCRNDMLNRLSKNDELGLGLLAGVPIVEIYGRRRILIENHCGILAYGTEEIKVKVKNGCICICGKCLKLARLSKEKLVITGQLNNVHMMGRD